MTRAGRFVQRDMTFFFLLVLCLRVNPALVCFGRKFLRCKPRFQRCVHYCMEEGKNIGYGVCDWSRLDSPGVCACEGGRGEKGGMEYTDILPRRSRKRIHRRLPKDPWIVYNTSRFRHVSSGSAMGHHAKPKPKPRPRLERSGEISRPDPDVRT